uniref:Rab-GAP TBC domain-containing protein n=1 Tax=Megaselia scalaris TaxID=36166 RepID=T1GFK8_MEGSC
MTLTTIAPTSTTTSQAKSESKMDVKLPSPTGSIVDESLPTSEMDLLAKLEAANKLIESDAKSLNSLHSTHSRKNSDTSQISCNSGGNSSGEEDNWTLWATIVNDWEGSLRRKNPCVRELATSACEKVIRRDIARTYPEHDFFKEKDGLGQEALFNVMKAYSLYDREVGYCQGSGFIVGLLLMQMPEEEAFAVLVQIMQQHRMRDMFKPSMAELGLCMYQLENLVQEQLPDLNIHFVQQAFQTTMYASSWFLTLYTTTLNLNLCCRIMDIFLSEGMEFIFKVALGLLTIGKEQLLCLDMEAMLKNSEMLAEGELRSNLDDSDKVRDLQDRLAEMKAEFPTPLSPDTEPWKWIS